MNFTNKTVLVTGGAGFIGSKTVEALITQGAKVVIIDDISTGREENLNANAAFYQMNMKDPELETVFRKERPEIVYHFAFNVQVPKTVENPLLGVDDMSGSINILQNARKYEVGKVFFASSSWVYGNTPNLPTVETEPMDPVAPYVIFKYAVEKCLEFYRSAYGVPYVVYRYPVVYGPGQTGGAMSDYIDKLAHSQQADIWGDGSKTRDYVYIDDVVRANLMACDIPSDHPFPVFNLGSGVETTLNELYQKIATILGKEAKPVYLADRPGELMRCILDYSKIKKDLNWEPEIDLDEGLRRRIKYYLGK